MTLAEAHQAAQEAVRHGGAPAPRSEGPPAAPSGSCARCGSPIATRPGARFCSAACRQAAVRDRRAAARSDLLTALAGLQVAVARVEAALKTMGLKPSHPRRPRARS